MSSEFDDRSLEQLRQALGELPAAASPECPSAERIWAGSQGRLEAEETRSLLDHSTNCAACAEAWRLARVFAAETGGGAETRVTRSAGRSWGWLAAAALLAFVAILLPLMLREEPEPVYRDSGAAAIRSLLPATGEVARDACELRWSAGPAGTLYTLEVASEELEVLHRTEGLRSAQATVPAETFAGVPDGGRILWRVEASLPSGETVESPTFVATVAGPPGEDRGAP